MYNNTFYIKSSPTFDKHIYLKNNCTSIKNYVMNTTTLFIKGIKSYVLYKNHTSDVYRYNHYKYKYKFIYIIKNIFIYNTKKNALNYYLQRNL